MTHRGQFQPGQSGNPAGKPKGSKHGFQEEVRVLARVHTTQAIATLVEIMSNTRTDPRSRVVAAIALLDRGWGKPELISHTTRDISSVRFNGGYLPAEVND